MIIVYTRPNCAYCPQVKKYLSHKDVPYRVEEAEGDNYTILSEKYGYTVPLVYNDKTDQGMVGYNIGKLKELVGI
jgi:glutaredoxin